jgi:PhzF family phenazine biosynthesis protein
MPFPVFIVDAFTDRPFAGNPAAVVLLDGPAPEEWMQALAGEHNLSETAYVHPVDGGWALRWFTPSAEVDLCGHATLATAHVLGTEGIDDGPVLRFTTRSGRLSAQVLSDDRIELDFPSDEPAPCDPPPGLIDALLGADAGAVVAILQGRFDYVVVVDDEAVVRRCRPGPGLSAVETRGVGLTAAATRPGREGGEVDVVSRFFAPTRGIDEDPVTGSLHCLLGPYWAGRLGRNQMVAYQASARGGTLEVEVRGDRVLLRGRAVTVSRNQLVGAAGPR